MNNVFCTIRSVVEDADSAVASVSAIDVGRIIGRDIVDDYDFPVRICLGKNAVDCLLQVAAVIVVGNKNGEHVSRIWKKCLFLIKPLASIVFMFFVHCSICQSERP